MGAGIVCVSSRCHFVLFRHPFLKVYGQLSVYLSPVDAASCPFFRYIYHGKVQHFEEAVVCWEY